MPKVVLHLKPADLSRNLKGQHLGLYRHIKALCENDGVPFDVQARDPDVNVGTRTVKDDRFLDGNLHIIDDRSVRSAGVLNAGAAYFWEFWHLDPQGTKAFSSIGEKPYHPDMISSQRAQTFVSNLRRRYLEKRRSKYNQAHARTNYPAGSISVFFQGQHPFNSGATRFSDIDMLSAVLEGAGDRPIVVKPHPHSSQASDVSALSKRARRDDRVIPTDGNVHDILAKSACTVSNNSTVALEGFLHGVPAILFGQADFHHVATTISNAKAFPEAFDGALRRGANYEQYLAWYFLKNCIHLNSGKLGAKIWRRFTDAGFPKEYFI